MNAKVPSYSILSGRILQCLILMACVFGGVGYAQKGIGFDINPFRKEAIFRDDDKIGYNLRFRNNTKEKIRGTIKAKVVNYKGEEVFNQEMGFTMDARKGYMKDLYLENDKTKPGFFSPVPLMTCFHLPAMQAR